MKLPRPIFLAARLCCYLFFVLTSVYCLITYIPFTYQQVHKSDLLPWLSAFVKWHPYLHWLVLGLIALTLATDLNRREWKRLTWGFLLFLICVGIVLGFRPLLSNLQNDQASFLWSLACLIPLLWLAAIDFLGNYHPIDWEGPKSGHERRAFRAAWQSGLFLALFYAGLFYARSGWSSAAELGFSQRFLSLVWSVASHLLVFMAMFVVLNLIGAMARLFPKPARVEFILCNILAGGLLWLVMRSIVLPPISFTGGLADSYSLGLALSFSACLAGLSVRLYPLGEGPVDNGLGLILTPVTLGHSSSHLNRVLSIMVVACLAAWFAISTASLDWNYLLQKTTVILIWAATFACFYAMTARKAGPDRTAALLLTAVLTLGAYQTLQASGPRFWALLDRQQTDPDRILERYSGYDVSFQLVRSLLAPPTVSGSFYRFLTQNTNIPRSTKVDPVEVNFVDHLAESGQEQPHIFIFVIDSLRRDYLSPYNKKVAFTPSIASFAQENIVLQNAFTHYGGTGLSEPSIWVGGMLLHKQYITPFAPMNALQKLLEAEKYQSYISKDSILDTVVAPSPSITELDQGKSTMEYDFCNSLEDLKQKIGQRRDLSRPIFAFTQPQNLHISVINREGGRVPQGEAYDGFHPPYASRLKRLDRCFGEFIEFLKAKGLYDKSIVILTTDHGDSLGEEGRWGHAYTIFPEVVRIPLIIHLPGKLGSSLFCDRQAVTFLTDITPSLYYLLGHKPVLRNDLLGRPLFTARPSEQMESPRDDHLIASSYAAVYGILRNKGRTLYVSDGVNYKDYLFDLSGESDQASKPVTAAVKSENERLIQDQILAINRFYGFSQPRH